MDKKRNLLRSLLIKLKIKICQVMLFFLMFGYSLSDYLVLEILTELGVNKGKGRKKRYLNILWLHTIYAQYNPFKQT